MLVRSIACQKCCLSSSTLQSCISLCISCNSYCTLSCRAASAVGVSSHSPMVRRRFLQERSSSVCSPATAASRGSHIWRSPGSSRGKDEGGGVEGRALIQCSYTVELPRSRARPDSNGPLFSVARTQRLRQTIEEQGVVTLARNVALSNASPGIAACTGWQFGIFMRGIKSRPCSPISNRDHFLLGHVVKEELKGFRLKTYLRLCRLSLWT